VVFKYNEDYEFLSILFQGFIDAEQLLQLAEPMKATGYGQYLIRQAGLLS